MIAQLEEFQVLTRKDYEQEWVESGGTDRRKPLLVKLRVKAAGRHWPDLIVRVKQ
jgi:hypothetical protein